MTAETFDILIWTVIITALVTLASGFIGALALAIRPLNGFDIALISIIALPLGYHLLSEAGLFLPTVFGALLASVAISWRDC